MKMLRIIALLCVLHFSACFLEAASVATAIDPTLQPVTLTAIPYSGSAITQLTLQPDGRILIAGVFAGVNGQPRNRLARLNADGSLDTSFFPTLPTNGWVGSMAVQNEGKILVDVRTGHGAITRLNPDGTIDTSFALPP